MKISVDDKDLFTLSDTQQQVIQNDIAQEIFEDDMKRRLEWVLMHKYEQCFKKLKEEWDIKLTENGVAMIPTNKDEYAKLVFSQPNYQCKSDRMKSDIKQ
jgi:hypothetical protein